ncbi:MAG TPA: OsmC family peroxiredoxin [Kouleothrix sp.]|uniref:OsmC family peroxiredoxin n=1 Tax=Kouleothrix sp. TaxID=2779161 RepID=UPI002C0409A6|nr:OsmC family peroxiredoxin [Kouleothrix sp.]HRC74830.1 OsmC family peroxiredoxin [Kouleothrix sp.]
MAEFNRYATSTWRGDLKGGAGTVSSESGALRDVKLTFVSRFENGGGSNPEELIAAAHAGCFSMALANGLSGDGHVPEYVTTRATVKLRMGEGGPKIAAIHLATEGKVPGIDAAAFQAAAEKTKQTCPVSRLLLPGLEDVTLEARLVE